MTINRLLAIMLLISFCAITAAVGFYLPFWAGTVVLSWWGLVALTGFWGLMQSGGNPEEAAGSIVLIIYSLIPLAINIVTMSASGKF